MRSFSVIPLSLSYFLLLKQQCMHVLRRRISWSIWQEAALHSLHSQLPVLVLYCMRWRHCSFGEGRMRRTAAPYYILYLRQHRQHYQLLQDPDAFICIRFAFMLHVLGRATRWQSYVMKWSVTLKKCWFVEDVNPSIVIEYGAAMTISIISRSNLLKMSFMTVREKEVLDVGEYIGNELFEQRLETGVFYDRKWLIVKCNHVHDARGHRTSSLFWKWFSRHLEKRGCLRCFLLHHLFKEPAACASYAYVHTNSMSFQTLGYFVSSNGCRTHALNRSLTHPCGSGSATTPR